MSRRVALGSRFTYAYECALGTEGLVFPSAYIYSVSSCRFFSYFSPRKHSTVTRFKPVRNRVRKAQVSHSTVIILARTDVTASATAAANVYVNVFTSTFVCQRFSQHLYVFTLTSYVNVLTRNHVLCRLSSHETKVVHNELLQERRRLGPRGGQQVVWTDVRCVCVSVCVCLA